jgi:hypothetical protein
MQSGLSKQGPLGSDTTPCPLRPTQNTRLQSHPTHSGQGQLHPEQVLHVGLPRSGCTSRLLLQLCPVGLLA